MKERLETRAVLFADICGSTRLIQVHGDQLARVFVDRCLGHVARVVGDHRGEVAARIGDELMCLFGRAGDAISAGLCIQDAVLAGGVAGDYPEEIRMHQGLHVGRVVLEGDQIFGDTIHVAKRLVDLAKPGQILTTPTVMKAAMDMPDLLWRPVDQVRVKGYESPLEIYEVTHDNLGMTMLTSVDPVPSGAETYVRCQLSHGGQRYLIDAEHPFFTIGRDPSRDLVLPYAGVSRDHARLEYQKGRIIFIDQSTNGTLIQEAGSTESVLVRREQRWLRLRGWLRFGGPKDRRDDLALGYDCEVAAPSFTVRSLVS